MTARILFCGGGTGGHLAPALAVARLLAARGHSVGFVLQGRAIERRFIAPEWEYVETLPIERSGEQRLRRVRLGLRLARILRGSARALEAFRPDVLLGLGGLASFFPLRAARRRRIPRALLEVNARPGRATRVLARRADLVLCGFESTTRLLRGRTLAVGIPVRAGIGAMAREEGRRRLGLPVGGRCLAVLGGSQGAMAINRIAALLAPGLLAAGHHIVQLCGEAQLEELRGRAATMGAAGRWIIEGFSEEMAPIYAAADLVLARAGASTVAELAAAGRASILVPYPHHRDQHQLWNARELAEGTRILEQESWDERTIQRVLALLEDRENLEEMGRRAAHCWRADASERIADKLLELGSRRNS